MNDAIDRDFTQAVLYQLEIAGPWERIATWTDWPGKPHGYRLFRVVRHGEKYSIIVPFPFIACCQSPAMIRHLATKTAAELLATVCNHETRPA